MKRLFTILLIIALLAGIVYMLYRWRYQATASQTQDYQTVAAERGNLISTIGATGTVHPKQSAILTWKTSGTVFHVNNLVGDEILAGDILADLEETSLPQNVILAQADLVNAEKDLQDLTTQAENAKVQAMQDIVVYTQDVKDAQYQLDNYTIPMEQADLETMEAIDIMQARLDAAREAFEPYKYLSSSNNTREELLEALNQAQADFNSAVKRLDYEYELAVANANLEKTKEDYGKWKNGADPQDIAATEARIAAAEATLNGAYIEAPFDGMITIAWPQQGDQVSEKSEAFRLDDLSVLLVDVLVSEVDINKVEFGQEASLTFDAIPGKEYHGMVVDVSQVGNTLQGLVDFNVTLALTDADKDVKSGMTAAVNIVVEELDSVILVPNRAVRVQDGQRVVYVLRNNQIVAVKIELGASSETMSEVVEGDIEVGDLIVLNPPTSDNENGGPPHFLFQR